MQEIEKLRAEIDQIQSELVSLFRRRLALTKKIWEIKKRKQMSFVDPAREEKIIHSFDESTSSEDEKRAIQNFLKNILSETKTYLGTYLK